MQRKGFLKYKGHQVHQIIIFNSKMFLSADADAALRDLPKLRDKLCSGGFSGPGSPDKGGQAARRQRQRDVFSTSLLSYRKVTSSKLTP